MLFETLNPGAKYLFTYNKKTQDHQFFIHQP